MGHYPFFFTVNRSPSITFISMTIFIFPVSVGTLSTDNPRILKVVKTAVT